MIKILAIGCWACAVALASSYATATLQTGGSISVDVGSAKPEKLEYRRPAAITVPMISDGQLRGYVVTRVAYTVNAADLATLSIDPDPFVLDETFRRIYTDGRIEFDEISKYNLEEMTTAIRVGANERLGLELVRDVLLDELNYVDKNKIKDLDPSELEGEEETKSKSSGGH